MASSFNIILERLVALPAKFIYLTPWSSDSLRLMKLKHSKHSFSCSMPLAPSLALTLFIFIRDKHSYNCFFCFLGIVENLLTIVLCEPIVEVAVTRGVIFSSHETEGDIPYTRSTMAMVYIMGGYYLSGLVKASAYLRVPLLVRFESDIIAIGRSDI